MPAFWQISQNEPNEDDWEECKISGAWCRYDPEVCREGTPEGTIKCYNLITIEAKIKNIMKGCEHLSPFELSSEVNRMEVWNRFLWRLVNSHSPQNVLYIKFTGCSK
jgi:hypothetical protein